MIDYVVYRWRPGQLEIPPLGNFLGQFTDETDEGTVIKFASSGAKNYGYLTRGGKTECKVSGFFLNFKTKQTLNYSSMRDNPLLLTFTHLLFQRQTNREGMKSDGCYFKEPIIDDR